MATEWKSQQADGKYYLQFETDNKEKYMIVEKAAQMAIDGKTTADYAEVKHGEWIKTGDDGGWKCSECGGEIIADAYGDVHPLDDCGWIGCPYCLAKMDGNNLSTIPTGSERRGT